jgi:putative ABC transport system permease protein
LGVGLVYGLVFLLQPLVESGFGLRIPLTPLTSTGYLYLAGVIVAGLAVGLIPAWKAYRNALADGLSVRI